jgi:(1->4)-alpha-D-glucan 1-alpha-D-glucosylmutase
VADTYQGNELWDFSLVDPDNRHPVDYARRRHMLESMREVGDDSAKLTARLMQTPEDGAIKLYAIWKTLCLRRPWRGLFRDGEYLPLAVEGVKANHVVAFARKRETSTVLVVVPRLTAGLLRDMDLPDMDLPPIGPRVWEDTQVVLPFCGGSEKYCNAFTGEVLNLQKTDGHARIAVSMILAEFPVALCSSEGC